MGPGRWQPRGSLGTVPVRFPSGDDPGDAGWHVEASFPGDDPGDYMSYRINVASRGRALLMLFLFSDVGPDDAPTVVRVGSHATVARLLAPAGEPGLSFMELAGRLDATAHLPHALADGPAGTVFLCQHFLNGHPLGRYAVKKIPVGDYRYVACLTQREPAALAERRPARRCCHGSGRGLRSRAHPGEGP